MVLAGSIKMRHYIAMAVTLMVLEALGLYLSRANILLGWAVVFAFYFLFYGVFQGIIYVWRIRAAVSLRSRWTLSSISGLLSFTGLMWRGAIFYNILNHGSTRTGTTNYTDLLLVLSMAPRFILLSLPNGKPYPRSFLWIDSIQIVLLVYLVYLKLFGVIPFTGQAVHPMPPEILAVVMAVFSLFILALVFLRYLGALTLDERRLYGVLSITGVVGIVLSTLHNKLGGTSDHATYFELLVSLSSYFNFGLFLSLPIESQAGSIVNRSSNVAETLNIVCPAFFTLALLAMAMDAAQQYFVFGMGAIAAAFVLHMIRSSILQKIYERTHQSLKAARDTLETMSLTDALTRVANRRRFDRTFEAEWNRATRTQEPLSLLMMDIDYFKHLNDRYGHQAGDDCLAAVAAALCGCLPRSGDLVARYGGEEFAVLLPVTDSEGARIVAAKMLEAVRSLALKNESPIGRYVTISVGIATCSFPTDFRSLQLLEEADKALYCAKEKGRDRAEVAANPALE